MSAIYATKLSEITKAGSYVMMNPNGISRESTIQVVYEPSSRKFYCRLNGTFLGEIAPMSWTSVLELIDYLSVRALAGIFEGLKPHHVSAVYVGVSCPHCEGMLPKAVFDEGMFINCPSCGQGLRVVADTIKKEWE